MGTLEEHITVGAALGTVAGIAAGGVVSLWGGYEIGSAVGNHYNLPSIGKVGIDLAAAGILLFPSTYVSSYIGLWGGSLCACLSYPFLRNVDPYRTLESLDKMKSFVGRVRTGRKIAAYRRQIKKSNPGQAV